MSKRDRLGLLITMIAATVAAGLQIIGLVRYTGRLPGDTVGIFLYTVTLFAFALIALVSGVRWFRGRGA